MSIGGVGACCAVGKLMTGTPAGTVQDVGGVKCYVSLPPAAADAKGGGDAKQPQQQNCALVLGTDIFGMQLINAQLTADSYARDLGIAVYVPDVFGGTQLPVWVMDKFLTLTGVLGQNNSATHGAAQGGNNEQPKPKTLWDKVARVWQILTLLCTLLPTLIPFALRHIVPSTRRTCKTVLYERVMAHLRTEHGVVRVGYAGYCYGVLYGLLFGTRKPSEAGYVDVNVLLHGEVTYDKATALDTPTLFICADNDHAFPDAAVRKVDATLSARNDATNVGGDGTTPKYVVRQYRGTYHGFTMRGNDDLPVVYKARQDAYAECVKFLNAHLIKPRAAAAK